MTTINMKHLKPFGQVGDSYYHGNAAAGILPICSATKKILLGYRSLDCNEPHTWGIFGGKSDDENESMREVAVREFYEETGYNGPLELIPAFVYEDRSHNFEYHSFIGVVPTEFVPRLNWENEKAKWFTYEEAMKLSTSILLYILLTKLKIFKS